ncbi:hypothetical protein ACQP60_10645 [Isoptericola variabilis]
MDTTNDTNTIVAPAADDTAAPADDPSHSPGPQPPAPVDPEAVRHR